MTARLTSLYAMPRNRLCQLAAAASIVFVMTGAMADARAATTDAASAPVEASAPLAAGSQYTIHPGQSLNDVAIAATQSHDRATLVRASRALFDANPNAFMGHDPSRLRLGSVLTIPALDATGAAVDAAGAAAASGASGSAGASSAQAAMAATAASQPQSGNATQTSTASATQSAPATAIVASEPVQPGTATAAANAAPAASEPTTAPGATAASAPAEASSTSPAVAVSASDASGTHPSAGASQASTSASATAPSLVPGSAPVQAGTQVSSLQQLLALKSRVLMELQKHGIGGGSAAQPSSGAAAVSSGQAGVTHGGVAPGAATANGGTAAGGSSSADTGLDLSSTNLGIAAAIGAALVALLAGLGLRRRKRAAAVASAADAAVAARAATVAAPVSSEDEDDAGIDVAVREHTVVEDVSERDIARGEAAQAAVIEGGVSAQEAPSAPSENATAHQAIAHDDEAHGTGVQEATTHDAVAHDEVDHHEAVHDGSTHEATAHDAATHDEFDHHDAAHDNAAHDATAHDATAHDEFDHHDAVHDDAAHAVTVHDATAHDETDHHETVRDDVMHDATVHDPIAHDVAAFGSVSQEATTGHAAADNIAAQEAETAAHEAGTLEPTARESVPEQAPAPAEALSPDVGARETFQAAAAYDPEAFPVNRPIEDVAQEAEPQSAVSGAAGVDHTPADQAVEHASQEHSETRAEEGVPQTFESERDLSVSSELGDAAPQSLPSIAEGTESGAKAGHATLASEAPAAAELPAGHDAAQAQMHAGSDAVEPMQDVEAAHTPTPSEPATAHAQPTAPRGEDALAAHESHAAEAEHDWGTPEAFPLPEPLDPFPAELAPPKGLPRDAVDAFSSLDFGLPPRLDARPVAPSNFSLDTHPVAEPEISVSQAVPPLETAPGHVVDEINAGTAGAASVAGLGAARFGALNLDFDLELPPSPAQPLPLFTPEDLGRIARNKLDLASEYIELGDLAGARALIHEVIEANDVPTRSEARALLSTLAPLS